jgi:hypothetical protein
MQNEQLLLAEPLLLAGQQQANGREGHDLAMLKREFLNT